MKEFVYQSHGIFTMVENKKRLFFGLEAFAPWPQNLPTGRLLKENQRHLTIAFLGNVDFFKLKNILNSFPIPSFKVGLSGKLDKCLFLPKKTPTVVAWHVDWMEEASALNLYQRALIAWLQYQGFNPDDNKDFLPHVTICRAPFAKEEWEQTFVPLPVIVQTIHLYESLGNLEYQSIWTFPLHPPFQEIEHTADIAFNIYGENLSQLQKHAFTALTFKFPQLLEFFKLLKTPLSLDELIANLNHIVALADVAVGCPFKAISYHGEINENADETITWEMIVDV